MLVVEGSRLRCRVEPDEDRRRVALRALVDELVALVDALGGPLPDEHGTLAHAAVRHVADVSIADGPVRRVEIWQRESASPGVMVKVDDRPPRWLPPGRAWTFQPLLVALLVRLHGDELTLDVRAAGDRPLLPRSTWVHPLAWWEDATSRPFEGGPTTVGEAWASLVHPTAAAWVSPGSRVLDLGGGDGALGVRLRDLGADVTVAEQHPTLVQAARTRGLPVVHTDLRAAWPEALDGPWDVITLANVLEANVMTRADALRIVAEAARRLRPAGRLVVVGMGATLVGDPGLTAAGLRVTNRTVPPRVVGEPVRTCLVAERPSA